MRSQWTERGVDCTLLAIRTASTVSVHRGGGEVTANPLRVLHVIPSLSMVHGGPSHAMRSMDTALREAGIHVDVVTTDDDGPGKRLSRPLGQPLFEDDDKAHGAHWYFHKDTEFYKCSWAFAKWINNHVRQYDVVHIHALFSFTSVIAARAAYRAGVPYVVRPLGTLSPYGLRERRALLKRWSLRWIEADLLRRASAIHVTSEQERNDVDALELDVRCVVIPLGLPGNLGLGVTRSAASVFPQLSGKRIVLFLSRLDPKKNVEALVDAFSSIAADFPDCDLVLAGAGDPAYAAQLRERAARSPVLTRIHWLGHVQGDAKSSLLASASLFVLPSFSENFGIAAAEALSAGLPCVLAEGVAIAGTTASAGAGLVTGNDAHSIADAMRTILSDDSLRTAMSANAIELASREFSTSAMTARLLALYNQIESATFKNGDVR